jgi:outer membrane protein OmpA-like peptidoglycan-associated protein
VQEDFASFDFTLPGGERITQQGKHWRSALRWADANHKPVATTAPVWLAALKAGGWTLLTSFNEGSYFTLQKREGGATWWLQLALGDYDYPEVEIIQAGGTAGTLVLTPPASQLEHLGERTEFPYLAKPEGAVFTGTSSLDKPLDVTVPGTDREKQLVGQGQMIKYYRPPAELSQLAFETLYRQALEQAGWTVKRPENGKPGSGRVVAHYAKNGRDLWTVLSRGSSDNGPSGIAFAVADIGGEDWASALRKDCRLALYGLNFDFNKAALKPDSTPVLEKLRGVLQADTSLLIDIQGHTDNVGGDDYNQTLSAARAKAVMDWLVANGIGAARLSSQGYGLKKPVAPNDTEENRARNRRVEIVRRECP